MRVRFPLPAPFPYFRSFLKSLKLKIPPMNRAKFQVLAVLLIGTPLIAAESPDCAKISLSVRASVESNLSDLLEIVAKEVSASPDCACEIVKASIEGSGANADVVASIVESAATASPENMRLIAQCAIATVPDSLAQVQAVLAKLDPNAGESGYSSKSSKSGKGGTGDQKADEGDNPLDFPGEDPYGRVSIGGSEGEGEGEGGSEGEGGGTSGSGTDGGTTGGTTTGGGTMGTGTSGGGTFGGGTFGGGFFNGGSTIGGFGSGGGFNFSGGNSGGGGGGGGGGIAPLPVTPTNPDDDDDDDDD